MLYHSNFATCTNVTVGTEDDGEQILRRGGREDPLFHCMLTLEYRSAVRSLRCLVLLQLCFNKKNVGELRKK